MEAVDDTTTTQNSIIFKTITIKLSKGMQNYYLRYNFDLRNCVHARKHMEAVDDTTTT